MLLSPTDKIRFKLCYPDYSHEELGRLFGTSVVDVIETAKKLGIFDEKRRSKDRLPSAEKNELK